MKKKVIKLIKFFGISFLLTLFITFLMHRPSMKVIAQWEQPDSIDYNDYSKCYLSVVESDIDWGGFPIHIERNYFIYIGRDAGTPGYGHMIKFSFHSGFEDTATFVKKSEVEWSDEGVTFIEASGHRLFVPKIMFIGGR